MCDLWDIKNLLCGIKAFGSGSLWTVLGSGERRAGAEDSVWTHNEKMTTGIIFCRIQKSLASEGTRTTVMMLSTPSGLSLKKMYLLTSWSRVLLEKLTGLQLIKKLSAFY
jgi:hypothetical protein